MMENSQNYFIEGFGRGINRFATGSGPTVITSSLRLLNGGHCEGC